MLAPLPSLPWGVAGAGGLEPVHGQTPSLLPGPGGNRPLSPWKLAALGGLPWELARRGAGPGATWTPHGAPLGRLPGSGRHLSVQLSRLGVLALGGRQGAASARGRGVSPLPSSGGGRGPGLRPGHRLVPLAPWLAPGGEGL